MEEGEELSVLYLQDPVERELLRGDHTGKEYIKTNQKPSVTEVNS